MIDYKKKYQKYKKKYALLCKLGGMLGPSQYKDTRCTFSLSGGLPLSIISANILKLLHLFYSLQKDSL